MRIDNSGSVRLTFDAVDLYPQETVALIEVRLFTNPTLAGKTLAAEWLPAMRSSFRATVAPLVSPSLRRTPNNA